MANQRHPEKRLYGVGWLWPAEYKQWQQTITDGGYPGRVAWLLTVVKLVESGKLKLPAYRELNRPVFGRKGARRPA